MYLHIGEGVVIRESDVIGIFDFETSTLSKNTKSFLQNKQKQDKINTIIEDIPKSFIVVKNNKKEEIIYFSALSSETLRKRVESNKI